MTTDAEVDYARVSVLDNHSTLFWQTNALAYLAQVQSEKLHDVDYSCQWHKISF